MNIRDLHAELGKLLSSGRVHPLDETNVSCILSVCPDVKFEVEGAVDEGELKDAKSEIESLEEKVEELQEEIEELKSNQTYKEMEQSRDKAWEETEEAREVARKAEKYRGELAEKYLKLQAKFNKLAKKNA